MLLFIFICDYKSCYFVFKALKLFIVVDIPTIYCDLILVNLEQFDPFKLFENVFRHSFVGASFFKPREQSQNLLVGDAATASKYVAWIDLSGVKYGHI